MHLSEYSEQELRKTIALIEGDNSQLRLKDEIELELVRRSMSPIEEIFPEGGYMTEDENHNPVFVPLKENSQK